MKSKTYMPALTGIRAIAAYLVFYHHNNRYEFPWIAQRISWEMHIGVNIFFVLSGFLIYYRYFHNVQLHKHWLGQYFVNRFARIYPILFILITLTYLFAPLIAKDSPFMNGDLHHPLTGYLLNITLLKGFFYNLNFSGIAQSWTLTIEECFYALAPLFFIIIRKDKKSFVYLPLILFGIGMLLVHFLSPFSEKTHGLYGNMTFMILYTFNGTSCEFFIGMALARILLKQEDTHHSKFVFTLTGGLIMLISVVILCSFKQTEEVISGLYHPVGMVVDHLLLSTGTAIFFYGLIKEQTAIKRFLSTRLMILLGKSSYAFYLIHVGFLSVFLSPPIMKLAGSMLSLLRPHDADFANRHDAIRATIFVVIMFVILNLIAIAIFKWIEEPLNNKIRALYKRRTAKASLNK